MKDLEIILNNEPGQLALLGETLGKNKISLEGGGVFQNGSTAIAHFLVEDAERAKAALTNAGIMVAAINEILMYRLNQELPGQLGLITRKLADAGINIIAQYSDHDNQLILVVDDREKAIAILR